MTHGISQILLIGGGHAHVAVLADWIENGLPAATATLLTPHSHLRYSGMVPGWISGQYDRNTGIVDVAALADRAGVGLVLDRCTGIDLMSREANTAHCGSIPFTTASIDTGGVGRARHVLGEDPRLIDIRPIDTFVDILANRRKNLDAPGKIVVAGGGAGGVELAFALRNLDGACEPPSVTVIAGKEGLLQGFSRRVADTVRDELARQSIDIVEADARIEDGEMKAGRQSFEADLIVAALGSAAPDWPRESGLACDEEGFIAVDRHQRSTSHQYVFAVGDIASRQDRNVPHSGVHAVMAGPILADNIRATAAGLPPSRIYRPRLKSLYLLSTGNGSAIASYGPLCAQGRWVARLKHWIDTRWISKYARLGRGL